MFAIHASRTLPHPVSLVFALFADHGGYGRFPGIKHCALVEEGQTQKNGVGALREVHLTGAKLFERITEFEVDRVLSYRVERSSPVHIDHQGGTMRFEALGAGESRVTWESKGRIAVPLVGRLIDRRVQKTMTQAFSDTLSWVADNA